MYKYIKILYKINIFYSNFYKNDRKHSNIRTSKSILNDV